MRIRCAGLFLTCLLLASIGWAQTVNEYTLPSNPHSYQFDSRVLAAPTHGGAVVIYSYWGGQSGTNLVREYIKSLVVDKSGIPGPATALVRGKLFDDAGAPGMRNHPSILDFIWNQDRKGFDLYFSTLRKYTEEIYCLPLDDRGRSAGKAVKLLKFKADRYHDYSNMGSTGIFLGGPGGRRVLLTAQGENGEILLRQFDMSGKILATNTILLGNIERTYQMDIVAFVNYQPDRYCLYTRFYYPLTGKSRLHVNIFSAVSLKQLAGTKNFTINTTYDNSTHAGGTHLFYSTIQNQPGGQYFAAYRTIGDKKSSISTEKTFPIGDKGSLFSVQSMTDRNSGETFFNIFTVDERQYPEPSPICLTRIDTSGEIVVQKYKVLETSSPAYVKQHEIAQIRGDAVVYVNGDLLLVSLPD